LPPEAGLGSSHLPPEAGGSAPRSPPLLLPTYCYNFVEFFQGLNAFYSLSKESIITANVLLLLLLHLFFTSNSAVFVDSGERIFLYPGRRVS